MNKEKIYEKIELLKLIKKLVQENNKLNKNDLLKKKEEILKDIEFYEREKKKYFLDNYDQNYKELVEKYDNKNHKLVTHIVLGLPITMVFASIIPTLFYLPLFYVLTLLLKIKLNNEAKLKELSEFEEFKDYVNIHKNNSDRTCRNDLIIMDIELIKLREKLKNVEKKLKEVYYNEAEINRLTNELYEEQEEKCLVKKYEYSSN